MTKKKMWDNRNLQQDIQWGNISLPGITDEELYAKNWNYVTANRDKANDILFKQKLSDSVKKSYENNPDLRFKKSQKIKETNKKIFNDPEFKKKLKKIRQNQFKDPAKLENLRKGIEKRNADKTWRDNLLKAIEKRNNNPIWKKNLKLSCQKRSQDPKHQDKMLRVHSYAIKTPDGVFAGLNEAHLFYNAKRNFNNGRKWILSMMKKEPNDYYKISWEEYDKLKS